MILVRLLRIALVTTLCVVAFAALFEFLNAVPTHLSLPDHPQGGVANPRGSLVVDALVWGVVFRAPGYFFNGSIPLLIVLAMTEWKAAKSLRWYLTIWIIAGLLATGFPVSDPLRLSAALLAAAATGYVYWLLAGKSAGDWLQAWRTREANAGRKLLNYAAYVVLAYLGYQLSGYLYYGGKLLWVSSGPEPDWKETAGQQLGTPRAGDHVASLPGQPGTQNGRPLCRGVRRATHFVRRTAIDRVADAGPRRRLGKPEEGRWRR